MDATWALLLLSSAVAMGLLSPLLAAADELDTAWAGGVRDEAERGGWDEAEGADETQGRAEAVGQGGVMPRSPKRQFGTGPRPAGPPRTLPPLPPPARESTLRLVAALAEQSPRLNDEFAVGGGRSLADELCSILPHAVSREWWQPHTPAGAPPSECVQLVLLLRATCALAAGSETPFSDFDDDTVALALTPLLLQALSSMARWRDPLGLSPSAAPSASASGNGPAPASGHRPAAFGTASDGVSISASPCPASNAASAEEVLSPPAAPTPLARPGLTTRGPRATGATGAPGEACAAGMAAGASSAAGVAPAVELETMESEREMVRLLALLAFHRPAVQALVAQLGGMAAVLQRCRVDERNPFIREWALLAVRNLSEGCEANQRTIAQIEQLSKPAIRPHV